MKRRQGIVQAGHRAAKEALPDADGVTHPEGNTDRCVNASGGLVRRGRRTQHAQTLLVREPGYLAADRRWCAPPVRAGKAARPKPAMNGDEKSDPAIVAARPANEPGQPGKERVERRAGAKGNAADPRGVRAQDRAASSLGIDRVRKTARNCPASAARISPPATRRSSWRGWRRGSAGYSSPAFSPSREPSG